MNILKGLISFFQLLLTIIAPIAIWISGIMFVVTIVVGIIDLINIYDLGHSFKFYLKYLLIFGGVWIFSVIVFLVNILLLGSKNIRN